MAAILIEERFDATSLDSRLQWLHPPSRWTVNSDGAGLRVEPDAHTDYWQKTHYGFAVDNGHFLYAEVSGDAVLTARIRLIPAQQYDQAGLMIRFSDECWLKASVEYEPEGTSKLGVVVTNLGYSDWSVQNFDAGRPFSLRVRREADDAIVEYSLDGAGVWSLMRICHFHVPAAAPALYGIYVCCPKEAGCSAEFSYLRIEVDRLEAH